MLLLLMNFPETTVQDGARLVLPVKDLGSCEIYPQSLLHSPNGRFVSVCGDGEYIIYTALAWRNKAFGSALDFVWGSKDNSNDYAIRESPTSVRIYRNFKEKSGGLDVGFQAEGLSGGTLLGVRGQGGVGLFDWESGALVRRIEVEPTAVSYLAIPPREILSRLTYNSRYTGPKAVNWSPLPVKILFMFCVIPERITLRPCRKVRWKMMV